MSYTLVDRAFDLTLLTRGERQTLQSLARNASHDGTNSYPSVETMMDATGLSRRGVQTSLRSLEEKKLIACKSGRRGGRYASAKYTLLIENWDEFRVRPEEEKQRNECALSDGKQRTGCSKGRTDCQNSAVAAENSAVSAPESVIESVKESVKESVNPAPQKPPTEGMDSLSPAQERSSLGGRNSVSGKGQGVDTLGEAFAKITGKTLRPTEEHRQFLQRQIETLGFEGAKAVVEEFATHSNYNWSKWDCPALLLKQDWDATQGVVEFTEAWKQQEAAAKAEIEQALNLSREQVQCLRALPLLDFINPEPPPWRS